MPQRKDHAMRYVASLSVLLLTFWLLLSGHYTFLLNSLGVLSVVLVVWLARRMSVTDDEMAPLHLTPRLPAYWLWLALEVIRSSIRVSLQIIAGRASINPAIGSIAHQQTSGMGETLLANSITLTPGTLAVRVHEDRVEIHALNARSLDTLENGRFAARIRKLETGQ